MKETDSIGKPAALFPGFIIGGLWLLMGIATLLSAMQGAANGRSGWGLGWGLVSFFLIAGGLSGLIGTWWHNFRVNRGSH